MRTPFAAALSAALLCACATPPAPLPQRSLQDVIAGPQRGAEARSRDVYRHPEHTLEYFGLQPGMTVVEVWPGGGGWYTEILAPYLRPSGVLYAAIFPTAADAPAYQRRANEAFRTKLAADPASYADVRVTTLGPPSSWTAAPAGSADLVLTFRNLHNWLDGGYEREMFAAFFRALKPGGVLGIVEHRASPGTPRATMTQTGYVTQDLAVKLAEQAGFRFVGWDDINENPRDDHDHPQGVWTLPPTLALGDEDRDRWLAIGESDRMTLKFVKPAP